MKNPPLLEKKEDDDKEDEDEYKVEDNDNDSTDGGVKKEDHLNEVASKTIDSHGDFANK